MKIMVKDSGRFKMRLWLPNSLITSHMFVDILKKHTDFTVDFSYGDVRLFRSELKKFREKHKNFILIEAKSKDGTEVTINI